MTGSECYLKTFVLGWYFLAVRHTAAVVDCHSGAGPRLAEPGDSDIGLEASRAVEDAARGPDGLPSCLGTCVTLLSLLLDRPHGPRAQQVHREGGGGLAAWRRGARADARPRLLSRLFILMAPFTT